MICSCEIATFTPSDDVFDIGSFFKTGVMARRVAVTMTDGKAYEATVRLNGSIVTILRTPKLDRDYDPARSLLATDAGAWRDGKADPYSDAYYMAEYITNFVDSDAPEDKARGWRAVTVIDPVWRAIQERAQASA